jgi:hypothetical protein
MAATTVKLDSDILEAIAEIKPRDQTLSAYVREVLRRDIQRQQMRSAAEKYRDLLRSNPAECKMLEEWESAPLATVARRRRK